MNKKFEEIRKILKPQKYSEITRNNCFGEFIEADDMIKILDYIRRQQDKIDRLKSSDKPSNCILGYVSTLVCPHCKSEDTDKVDGIWFCNNCTADNF